MGQFKHRTTRLAIDITGNKNFTVLFRVNHIHGGGSTGSLAIFSVGWNGLVGKVFRLKIILLHRGKHKP
jgi:hypothetical protein